ncbi:MAG: hypothetical protein J6E42_08770 [Firmicutes bacterium]|nr:hypothetical protein [Bacillota bacterium]
MKGSGFGALFLIDGKESPFFAVVLFFIFEINLYSGERGANGLKNKGVAPRLDPRAPRRAALPLAGRKRGPPPRRRSCERKRGLLPRDQHAIKREYIKWLKKFILNNLKKFERKCKKFIPKFVYFTERQKRRKSIWGCSHGCV